MKYKKIFFVFIISLIIFEDFIINVIKTNKIKAIGVITTGLSYGGVDRFVSLFLNIMVEKQIIKYFV